MLRLGSPDEARCYAASEPTAATDRVVSSLLGGVLLAVGLFSGAFQGMLGFLIFTYQLLVVVAIAYLSKALADVRRELAAHH
jgi:hypothetical protein